MLGCGKLFLALVVTAKRLHSYFLSHPIVVLIDYILKRILDGGEAFG